MYDYFPIYKATCSKIILDFTAKQNHSDFRSTIRHSIQSSHFQSLLLIPQSSFNQLKFHTFRMFTQASINIFVQTFHNGLPFVIIKWPGLELHPIQSYSSGRHVTPYPIGWLAQTCARSDSPSATAHKKLNTYQAAFIHVAVVMTLRLKGTPLQVYWLVRSPSVSQREGQQRCHKNRGGWAPVVYCQELFRKKFVND